jgi:membrane associated rhomboid family serine protease
MKCPLSGAISRNKFQRYAACWYSLIRQVLKVHMAYRSRSNSPRFFSPDWFPPGVKWLLIVNTAIFLLLFFTTLSSGSRWYSDLALQPASVVRAGAIWQLVTYFFIHVSPQHYFWNALSLWMFGMMIERAWGTRRFLEYYFICGIGAGIITIIGTYLFFSPLMPFIGASGAVFGLLVAFGFVFAEQTVMFSFVFPMKGKYMAALLGAFWFLMTLDTQGAFIAHVGGMLTGLIYMLYFAPLRSHAGGGSRSQDSGWLAAAQQRYKMWKTERARKKFKVYLRKNDPDRDRWVN